MGSDVVTKPLIGLFLVAWCVAAAGVLCAVVEGIGQLLLRPWAFRIGPVALTLVEESVPCPVGLAVASVTESARAKYRVLDGHLCLFRRKLALFEFRLNTPFEVKGSITWSNGKLTTMGRYPLGVTVFYLGWLVGWTVGGLNFTLHDPLVGLRFLLFGWLFGGGIMVYSRSLELKRFRERAAEVVLALRGQSV
jgi:hypothetical protein